ncbi:unnamed protein product [Orchesella dallaii]|uniref:Uncharacterized protein n=1 Tax=Orchesella dallaii TaxID=48710 RepID=A0ABP1QZV7_9HEXA
MDGHHELLKQLIHNYVQASNLLVQHLVEDINRQNLENWNQKYKNALDSTRFYHIERKLTKWCETFGYEYPEPASRQRKCPRLDILRQSLDRADINLPDTEEAYEPSTSQSASQSLTLNYSNNDRDPPHTFNVLLQHHGSLMGTLNPMQSCIESGLPDLGSISSEFQADQDLQVNTGSTTTSASSQGAAYVEASNEL